MIGTPSVQAVVSQEIGGAPLRAPSSVMVETPVNLTPRQKELLKEFDSESATETHSPQAHGFFGKVRELWEDLKE